MKINSLLATVMIGSMYQCMGPSVQGTNQSEWDGENQMRHLRLNVKEGESREAPSPRKYINCGHNVTFQIDCTHENRRFEHLENSIVQIENGRIQSDNRMQRFGVWLHEIEEVVDKKDKETMKIIRNLSKQLKSSNNCKVEEETDKIRKLMEENLKKTKKNEEDIKIIK